jgi:cystathionine beta-lyase/cystathionine gamma-synthase
MTRNKNDHLNYHIDTLAVHAGVRPDPMSGAIMTPIYQTSTYVQDDVGQHLGYEYSRTDNPTRSALQESLAVLEGGQFALAFASGMAAIDTLLRLIRPGQHIISGDDVYGGTFRLFDKVLANYGLDFTFVDASNPGEFARAVRPETKLVWLETPTNPMLRLADIKAIADISHEAGAWLGVDNTFATPVLQKPLEFGADFVIHSTTKYLGGHSDVVGGAIILNDENAYSELKFLQNGVGAVPGPMDCFLTLRGIKTLALRMKTHCDNAMNIAEFLNGHPAVAQTIFPGLPAHPQHDLLERQMSGPGGMVSFMLKGGEVAARAVVQKTKLFTLAESLGGVESLIELPALMTHASVADSHLAVDPSLVRLSVGIEHAEDLISDLDQAFYKL